MQQQVMQPQMMQIQQQPQMGMNVMQMTQMKYGAPQQKQQWKIMWQLEGNNTCSKVKHKPNVSTYTHAKHKPHSSNECYIIPRKRHKMPKERTPRDVCTPKPPAVWENTYAWILRNTRAAPKTTTTKNTHSTRDNYAANTILSTVDINMKSNKD